MQTHDESESVRVVLHSGYLYKRRDFFTSEWKLRFFVLSQLVTPTTIMKEEGDVNSISLEQKMPNLELSYFIIRGKTSEERAAQKSKAIAGSSVPKGKIWVSGVSKLKDRKKRSDNENFKSFQIYSHKRQKRESLSSPFDSSSNTQTYNVAHNPKKCQRWINVIAQALAHHREQATSEQAGEQAQISVEKEEIGTESTESPMKLFPQSLVPSPLVQTTTEPLSLNLSEKRPGEITQEDGEITQKDSEITQKDSVITQKNGEVTLEDGDITQKGDTGERLDRPQHIDTTNVHAGVSSTGGSPSSTSFSFSQSSNKTGLNTPQFASQIPLSLPPEQPLVLSDPEQRSHTDSLAMSRTINLVDTAGTTLPPNEKNKEVNENATQGRKGKVMIAENSAEGEGSDALQSFIKQHRRYTSDHNILPKAPQPTAGGTHGDVLPNSCTINTKPEPNTTASSDLLKDAFVETKRKKVTIPEKTSTNVTPNTEPFFSTKSLIFIGIAIGVIVALRRWRK
eukprot:g2433.t1